MRYPKLVGILLGILCCAFPLIAQAADVTITNTNNVRKVTTSKYEASVAADGCQTSMKVNGQEFFKSDIGASRGTYLYQNGTLALSTVEQQGDNVILAQNDKASLRYEFAADKVAITATNKTAQSMSFYMVFDTTVKAVSDNTGKFLAIPANQNWPTANFFQSKAKLTITGGTRIWGPWSGPYQVWEATLQPNATAQVVVSAGTPTADELAKLAEFGGQDSMENMVMLSPMNYQVFQRQTRLKGNVRIAGRVLVDCDKVEFRLSGKSLDGNLPGTWQAVTVQKGLRNFDGTFPVSAGGWYKFEIRATNAGKVVAQGTISKVGVGEVFVGAGQSNSTNYGSVQQQPTSGMVSTFSGADWRIANDPQPGTHDKSSGGSFWPAFGDAMYAKYGVPIGFAVTGHGGTSVNQWQPGSELFNWMMTRMYQLGKGGFRAVLWHQGESDTGMNSDDYARLLTNVIWGSKVEAGWEFPWFVAQVSYHDPTHNSFDSTRNAQKQLWDSGVALEGPDTDTLTGDNRAGIHFGPKGLQNHGKMWTDKVSVYLDKVLAN